MNGSAPPTSAPPALTAPAQAQEGIEATRPSSVTAVDWADTAGPAHEAREIPPRPSTDSTSPRNRFSLDKFRRPPHPGHTENEGAVGHQARMLYALITGLPSGAGAQVTPEHALGRRARAGDSPRLVPIVKPKALKKLKADLIDADKAKRIVIDLKRMDPPTADPAAEAEEPSTDSPLSSALHVPASRGYALPPLDSNPTISFASLPPVSPGALAGLAGAQSGGFELLADMTGALIGKSGAHQGVFVPPVDRISVFVCAPELAPFIRYIASYCDMEWSAIKAQDRGHGVVLAATWLLPVALVPRPWDFPVSLPSPHPPRKLATA
ncbi:hypothetical protein NBRC10513_002171 [Rhodotorula toruloides]|uniref:Uncharacterized protein n=1 Tax=Rhodotorula toruloides TaxID=5286 RepID=A0A2T0A8S1_RHOTO|nr:hypothetical protein AAT19DRAFT_14731 [Rhodotorula toruloides]